MMDGVRSGKSEDGQCCEEEEGKEAEEVVMHIVFLYFGDSDTKR